MGRFDFLKTGLNFEKKVAGKAFQFLTGAGGNLSNIPSAVINQNRKKTNELAVGAGRGVLRQGLNVGVSVADLIPGNPDTLKVTNPIAKKVLGGEPIESYQKRAKGIKQSAEKSRFHAVATPLAVLGTAANLAGDVTGFGGAKKAAGKEIIEQLAKEATEKGVQSVLKKAGTEVSSDVVKALASTKDKNIVENILKGSSNIKREVPTMVPPPARPPKNIVDAAIPKAPKPPTVISRSPTESPELVDLVKRGKLQKAGDTAPIDSLKLGSDTKGKYDTDQVAKYVKDIKNEHTIDPIVIDNKGFVQDGKHRLEAMRQLGVKDVPVVEQIPQPKLSGAAQQSKLSRLKTRALTPLNQEGSIQIPGRGKKNLSDSLPNDTTGVANPAKLIASKAPAAQDIKSATIPKTEVIPPKSDNPFDEILGAVKGTPAGKGQTPIKGAVAAMKEQERLLSAERGARFKAGAEAGKKAQGSEGYFNEVKALKGEYSRANYHPMIKDIGPERAEQLFTSARQKILDTPDSTYEALSLHPGGARLNTQRAVRKVLGLEPGVPTRSELKLLSVYSPKLAEGIKESIPVHRKIFDAAATIFGNSRAAKSTLDLSMGGRQGLFVAARHPKEWGAANVESLRYAKDKDYFTKEMKAIHDDEWGKLIDKHNPSVLTGGLGHEEQYAATDIVGKVPGVKAAERAYTGGLTKLRKDVLTKAFSAYGDTAEEVERTLGDKGVNGLIEAVSTLTGRGGKAGGFVEKHATTLQEALFSPRLWASRLQPLNPAFWSRIGPAGRKEALQSLGSFAAVAGTVLGAAVAAGAEVETDPRSSDFLKIKVGDTRYDILGGFQQNLVFGARQLSGSTKSSTTGAVTKFGSKFGSPTRLSASLDLLRNKANPVLGAGANILEGKDKAGNKVNPLTEIGQLFVPINLQNAFNSRDNPKDILKSLPDFVGIGSQTYGVKDTNISDKQKATVSKITDKKKQEAYTRFYQTSKVARGTRQNVSDSINDALESRDLKKAQKLAEDYNKSYSSAFKEWRSQYKDYSDAILAKEYSSNKINLTPASIKARLKAIAEK